MLKIALMTYPYLTSYFEQIATEMQDECEIEVIEFKEQHFLLKMIPDMINQYDGACVFSALTEKFLHQSSPHIKKPIVYLDRNSVNFFKTFFIMLSKNRDIDFSRVLLDTTMIHPERSRTLNDIMGNLEYFEQERYSYPQELSLDDFTNMEKQIVANAKDLWQRGKFDMLICRNANVAAVMHQEKIPYEFVLPERYLIKQYLAGLLNRIRLDKLGEGLPASIMIYLNDDNIAEPQTISQNSIRIQQALLEFGKNYAPNFTIQHMPQGYEVLTSHLIVQQITLDFTVCQLGYFLFSTLGINLRIGYGIGNNISSARQNAIQARKATEDSQTSCVITETGKLIPVQAQKAITERPGSSENMLLLANKAGLSVVTVQRIRSALQFLGTNEITNQDLAEALQVTVANANRFLNNLAKSGNAEVINIKKSMSKGRPSRVYRIRL